MEKIKLIALFLAIPLLVLGQDSKTQEIEVIGVGKITTQADFSFFAELPVSGALRFYYRFCQIYVF